MMFSKLQGGGGGRPAILMSVFLIQTTATVFFVVDTIGEVNADGFTPHQWFEGLVTLALLLGLVLGVRELARVSSHQRLQDDALAKASGEMHRVIQSQFKTWHLTTAERDVAYLALKGLDTAEIAALRKAAQGTVRAQMSSIYAKSGISGRAQFAAFFVEDLLSQGLPTSGGPQTPDPAATPG